MNQIFTIGFTKKTAQEFFTLLERAGVEKVIDVRLNNTSQLAAFSKFPDVEFFLRRILNVDYAHDKRLAPTEIILNGYKKKLIDWRGYESAFDELMTARRIEEYIAEKYSDAENLCLLCSEPTPENCHRRLVAEKFRTVFACKIVHL